MKYNKMNINLILLRILHEFTNENTYITKSQLHEEFCKYIIDNCPEITPEMAYKTSRHTIRNNLNALIDMGYKIDGVVEDDCDSEYLNKKSKKCKLENNENELSDKELLWLAESVRCSYTIGFEQKKHLMKKLKNMCTGPFIKRQANKRVFYPVEIRKTYADEVMDNIVGIAEAINDGKKIKFVYNYYGIDGKHVPKFTEDINKPYYFILSPYYIVTHAGRYYLIGNKDKSDEVRNYRIDRISRMEILSENIRPAKEVGGPSRGFDVASYLRMHPYMGGGEEKYAQFRIKNDRKYIDKLVDTFGTNISIVNDGKYLLVQIKADEYSLLQFSLTHHNEVELLEPIDLREQLKERIKNLYAQYL